jgi:Flp pilus assembly protein TadG
VTDEHVHDQPVAAPAPVRVRRDRGSVSVELAILSPVLVALVVAAIVVGRTGVAYNSVAAAAYDASRAASISRTEEAAVQQASAVAQTTLDNQGIDCATTDIAVDASGLNVPVGEPAMVSVTVTCELSFADVGLPTRTLEATFYSPVDTWRGRSEP